MGCLQHKTSICNPLMEVDLIPTVQITVSVFKENKFIFDFLINT